MELFKLFGRILIDSDEADKSLKKTESGLKKFTKGLGSGIKTAAKWGAAFTGAAVGIGAAALKLGDQFAQNMDRIDKESQKLGLSRQGFQEWEFVLSQAGVSIDSMNAGMNKMTKAMAEAAEGTGIGAETFEKLGISVTDSTGAMKSQEEVFNEAVLALQNMEDGAEKAALATDLFGKSGQELIPLLNSQAGSVEELKKQAQDLGLVMGDEAIDAGVKYTDTMDQIKRSLGAAGTELISNLMPYLQNFLDWVLAHMPEIKEFIGNAMDGIVTGATMVWNFFKDNLLPIFETLWELFRDSVLPVLNSLWELLEVLLPPAIDIAVGAVKLLAPVFETTIEILKTVVDWLTKAIEGFIELLGLDNEYKGKGPISTGETTTSRSQGGRRGLGERLLDDEVFQYGPAFSAATGYSQVENYVNRATAMQSMDNIVPSNQQGVTINMENVTVREDADIDKIARELYNRQQSGARGGRYE